MLAGAAMAAVPQAAATRAVSGSQPGAGFRSAVSGGRAALLRPTAARRPVRAAPVLTRAGEALDWENDDFVPASKANKKKKSESLFAAGEANEEEQEGRARRRVPRLGERRFRPCGQGEEKQEETQGGQGAGCR